MGKGFAKVDVGNGLIAKIQLQGNDAVWMWYVGAIKRDGYARFMEAQTERKVGLLHSETRHSGQVRLNAFALLNWRLKNMSLKTPAPNSTN
jgi:hypothetical protein